LFLHIEFISYLLSHMKQSPGYLTQETHPARGPQFREILRGCCREETLEGLPSMRNHTPLHHTRPHPKELIGLLESIHIAKGGNEWTNNKATLDDYEQWSRGQISATLARDFGREVVLALKAR
jgi:hypothetical protein